MNLVTNTVQRVGFGPIQFTCFVVVAELNLEHAQEL